MTEQKTYTIYKITNSEDDKVYIGSTTIPLSRRMSVHRYDARNQKPRLLYQHMRKIGVEKFTVHPVKVIISCNKKVSKIIEQITLWSIPIENRLNTNRAHIPNIYYRGNVNTKRKNRRNYYHRKKQDPEWVEKERERNRIRMRKKRDKERRQRLNGYAGNRKIQSGS